MGSGGSESMCSIDDIVRKEMTYKRQMADIRQVVLSFMEPKGWSPMSRGRRAHVSLFGVTNGLHGVIDIETVLLDWDRAPDSLQRESPFTLWCSASLDREGVRLHADTELYWTAPFGDLLGTVVRFLPRAWEMLTGLSEANLVDRWPGPSVDPDPPPDFGPPRSRRAAR